MPKTNKETIYYLKIFLLILFVGAVLSLILKTYKIIHDRSLKTSSFNILYLSKDAYAMHFDASEKTINIIDVKNAGVRLSVNNRIENSLIFKIPFDGMVIADSDKSDLDSFFSSGKILGFILNRGGYKADHLNEFDFAKIYFYHKFFNANGDIKNVDNINNYDLIQKYIQDLFKNQKTFNDKSSIEIINNTNVNGLGSNVAQMLTNAGYNVVSITSNKPADKSKIINRTINSDSVKNLISFFNLSEMKESGVAIADISIVINQDWAANYGLSN